MVWAADAHTAIFDLLGGRYLDERIRHMFEAWKPVQPLVQVCLGVARDLSAEPLRTVFELDPPLEVAGEPRKWISVLQRSHDSTMAPAGKTVVEVWYPTSFEYWENLAGDRIRYEAEKKRIADGTIAELDRRWPGFAGQVEVVDVPDAPHLCTIYRELERLPGRVVHHHRQRPRSEPRCAGFRDWPASISWDNGPRHTPER